MNRRPRKLYVVVRDDLSDSQRAVQAGHAVAQFMKENPGHEWGNQTLVYLVSSDLKRCMFGLRKRNIGWTEFREPDIGNQITAIASYHDGKPWHKLAML